MSLLGASSLSRSWISPTTGEEDEVEEDDEEWISRLEGVFEVDEEPEVLRICKVSESRF